MLIPDIPNVPPQATPIVVAQKSQAAQQGTDRTIGVCVPIENSPESRLSAVNSLSPILAAYSYLKKVEHQIVDEAALRAAKMTLLQPPTHGEIQLYEDTQSGRYFSADYNYMGADRASVLVEIGSFKVKTMYFFNLMHDVPGSSDQGTATDNKTICPNGHIWKISLNPDGGAIK